MNWRLWAAVAAIGGFVYVMSTRRGSAPGMVATGWGGNWTGNMPTLLSPRVIVGNLSNGQKIYGPTSASGAARGASQSYAPLP